MTVTTTLHEFHQAIESAGLTPPAEIIPDGKIHRFASNGDRADDAGFYLLYPDGVPAGVFGCWRSGLKETWCGKSDHTLTDEERAAYRARIAGAQRQREADERRRHVEAAAKAQAMWGEAAPASAHPYLERKQVQPHGLRVWGDLLLIPMRDADDLLHSYQAVDANGEKRFLAGGRVKGCFHLMGIVKDVLIIVEGYATGASISESAGFPVAVAFSSGNLLSVAQALRDKYPSARLVIAGDHDRSGTGQQKAKEAAEAVNGLCVYPDTEGDDFNDVAVREGLEAVRLAITKAIHPSDASSDNAHLTPGVFHPIAVPDLLDEPEPAARDWIWEDFLMAGGLAALVAKPKVGKTTNAYELAVRVAQGLPYLGRTTRPGPVLILALEEHRREVKQRLRNLGADQLDNIHVHVGPLDDSPNTFHELLQFIKDHGIVLMILDTLNSFWSVQEENDSVGVTQAIKPLLSLARESGAAILLLHHARKSEGEHGDEIRGSGALFSLLDVALILKRHEVENQRKLSAVGRYPETPPELIIELRDHGHEALGDPAAIGKVAKRQKLLAALSPTPASVPDIATRARISRGGAYGLLAELFREGQAQRVGTGKRKDPHLYFVSCSPHRGGGPNETKHAPPPSEQEPSSPGESPGEFVSFGVPFLDPRTKTKQESENGFVSFGGPGGQTIRNNGSQPDLEVLDLDV